MNLKFNAIILLIGCALGGFSVFKLLPSPALLAPVAIPESEELSKLKKQLAEYSSQKKSVIKEYNCANGALSKETSVDEQTAAKIAKESEAKTKKIKELVIQPAQSKYALGLFREYDFKNQKDIYELSIYRHVAFGFHVGFSASTSKQYGIGILKTF